MSFLWNLLFPVKTSDPTDTSSNAAVHDPLVQGKFTPRELSRFNGHDEQQIFIAVKGTVFDVSNGRQFYGPSGPYANFAGHDASRGLALNSFDFDVLTEFDQPIDKLEGLNKEEKEALDGWEEHFKKKYPIVGELVQDK